MELSSADVMAEVAARPGAKLDDTEKMCTAKCMDRYLDAMALVSQAWAARAKQQAQMPGIRATSGVSDNAMDARGGGALPAASACGLCWS